MTETKEKETEQRPQPLTLKRLLSALCTALLLLSSLTVTATAAETTETGAVSIYVVLNGKELAFDTEPEIKNGSLFVPLRSIFEELGAEVEWSAARQEAYLTSGSEEICLKVGSAVAIHNTDVTLLTDPPYLKEGNHDSPALPRRIPGLRCELG